MSVSVDLRVVCLDLCVCVSTDAFSCELYVQFSFGKGMMERFLGV